MKNAPLVNIGFGNTVATGRIIAVVSPESSPIKRLVQDAREQGRLVDATYGRRTRAVIICDNFGVVLSCVQPDTLANRIAGAREDGRADGDGDGDYGEPDNY